MRWCGDGAWWSTSPRSRRSPISPPAAIAGRWPWRTASSSTSGSGPIGPRRSSPTRSVIRAGTTSRSAITISARTSARARWPRTMPAFRWPSLETWRLRCCTSSSRRWGTSASHPGACEAADGMFPYHDENETQRTTFVTYTIIALNVLVWFVAQGAGSAVALARSVCEWGLIAGELSGLLPPGTRFPMGEGLVCLTDPGRQVVNVLTSMFLHGSWMHLIGNMWFLWIFGNNIEDSMGHLRFVVFYLLCGTAAALLQVWVNPASVIPMVGASGAISGVMGAYLVLYPRVRVFAIVPIGFIPLSIALPAWTMLLYWAGLQIVSGLIGLLGEESGGVAFWAHVGGFGAGLILIKLFARRDDVQAHRREQWQPRRVAARW